MARKGFSEDDPVPRPRAVSLRGEADDIAEDPSSDLEPNRRVLDLEPEQDSPFLRSQKRVPVRRGPFPRKTANRLKYVLVALAISSVLGAIGGAFYHYGRNSWRFRLESSDAIQLSGNVHVSRRHVIAVFGADISRNVFLIPLEERKRQLELIPWVESATVMRLLPNRISVRVRERTPVAFAQVGSRIVLVDANGVLMDIPRGDQHRYSFPVIIGTSEADPLSTRAARLRTFEALMRELDAGGANYSRDVSEVDLSDPEDVRITVADPHGEVLIHLGSGSFLDRYKLYVGHAQEWRQQFQKLQSVDLRYDRQVIVNPDASVAKPGAVNSPAASAAPTPRTAVVKPKLPAPSKHGKMPATHRR